MHDPQNVIEIQDPPRWKCHSCGLIVKQSEQRNNLFILLKME